jgi:hypothetical protein
MYTDHIKDIDLYTYHKWRLHDAEASACFVTADAYSRLPLALVLTRNGCPNTISHHVIFREYFPNLRGACCTDVEAGEGKCLPI